MKEYTKLELCMLVIATLSLIITIYLFAQPPIEHRVIIRNECSLCLGIGPYDLTRVDVDDYRPAYKMLAASTVLYLVFGVSRVLNKKSKKKPSTRKK